MSRLLLSRLSEGSATSQNLVRDFEITDFTEITVISVISCDFTFFFWEGWDRDTRDIARLATWLN